MFMDRIIDANLIAGMKIKYLRKKKGLTTSELGGFIGFSQQQISRYERGINCIHIDLLVALSFFFEVPISVFFESEN